MPTITIHPPNPTKPISDPNSSNPLPKLLQTPSGLAILEIQGTINLPDLPEPQSQLQSQSQSQPQSESPNQAQNQDQLPTANQDGAEDEVETETPIGRLEFPLYNPVSDAEKDTAWMKRVYLYIGKHQRMTGEVKKLAKPLAVLRRREVPRQQKGGGVEDGEGDGSEGDLEIAEIVRFKVLFASRPEPVGLNEGV